MTGLGSVEREGGEGFGKTSLKGGYEVVLLVMEGGRTPVLAVHVICLTLIALNV